MSIFDMVSKGMIPAEKVAGRAAFGGAIGAVKKRMPTQAGPILDAADKAIGGLARGDVIGAIKGAINSGLFTSRLPFLDAVAAESLFMAQSTRAMAGIAPLDAMRMMQETLETHFARKNLFMVELSRHVDSRFGVFSANYTSERDEIAEYSAYQQRFNLFVVDANYTPVTITGDHQKIGAAALDLPSGIEHVNLRLTTFDDESGSVKRWFQSLAGAVAHADGTFGVPSDYLVQIRILHSFVTDDSARQWLRGGGQPWESRTWFRPESMELSMSRREDGLEELSLSFQQFNTCFR